ncbi:TadE/TadG family type IV pilus assembly protein [Zobellella iuensis]|uniref:Tad domain-containing protein n=1 Tax=Zobellella iuensis TaxID=2803811 RepID=A0ABS1QUA9_9GAMM|nr:TadE/TadG family type IV pilus assembly protein [Zobellella iuensis]MBL1378443.1 Tad domain-containing protein [Zobellella iuensis]
MQALSHRKQQKGAVLILVTVAMFVLLGFTALALDGGYLLLNKTRVQDAVDAAALSGAKTLDDGGTQAQAEQAVKNTLVAIFQGEGFSSVNVNLAQLDNPDLLQIQFSHTVSPFTPINHPDASYIRVTLGNVPVTQFFSQLVLDTWQVWASAVAGPSPPIQEEEECRILPLLMCAGDLSSQNEPDYNFGFTPSSNDQRGDVLVIKAPNHNRNSVVGPGNFMAIDLDGVGGGANEFRDGLAGNVHGATCVPTGDTVETKTGNMVGPTQQGLNTRFGEYLSPMSEPTTEPVAGGAEGYYADCEVPNYTNTGLELVNFVGSQFDSNNGGNNVLNDATTLAKLQDYPDYAKGIAGGSKSTDPGTSYCLPKRRMVRVPVANCTGHNPGQSTLTVMGTACMFLIQKVTGQGNTQFVVAEFVENCTNDGTGFNSNSNSYRLVLYKDYGSNGGS